MGSLRDGIPFLITEITSAGHQYASSSPRFPTGCPDRSTNTQTHEPSLSLSQVSRGNEIAGVANEMLGEEFVRANTDLPDPNTPLRIFLTLEVSAGVFGGAPSVKEAEEIREREEIKEDGGLCFEVFCIVLGGGLLACSAINRAGVRIVWSRVGDSGSSSEDKSLRSESNPDGIAARLVPLTFRGESSDFRVFEVDCVVSGVLPGGSTLRARGRLLFFLPLPSPDVPPLVLVPVLGFDFEPSPPSNPSSPSSSSDDS